MMKTIPVPPAEVNCGMTVIKTKNAVNNDLMIGSDIELLRANKIEDEIVSMNCNFMKEGG